MIKTLMTSIVILVIKVAVIRMLSVMDIIFSDTIIITVNVIVIMTITIDIINVVSITIPFKPHFDLVF